MTLEPGIHSIQARILIVLLFKPQARFSELNLDKIPTDHFTFHLKRLIELSLVKKLKNGRYCLTTKGKELANRFDTGKTKFEKQAKLSVVVCGVKLVGGLKRYLVQQRLKQPFYGYHGFVTGKIRWGETVTETAKREFKEETGLDGEFNLAGIEHKIDYSQAGNLLEDKFFFIFRVVKLQGELVKSFTGGENIWLTKEKIKKLPKKFRDVMKILRILDQKGIVFWENKFVIPDY